MARTPHSEQTRELGLDSPDTRRRQRGITTSTAQTRPSSDFWPVKIGLEETVIEALIEITRTNDIDWLAFKSEMQVAGRYHVELCADGANDVVGERRATK